MSAYLFTKKVAVVLLPKCVAHIVSVCSRHSAGHTTPFQKFSGAAEMRGPCMAEVFEGDPKHYKHSRPKCQSAFPAQLRGCSF